MYIPELKSKTLPWLALQNANCMHTVVLPYLNRSMIPVYFCAVSLCESDGVQR